jgi:hypothetical protein
MSGHTPGPWHVRDDVPDPNARNPHEVIPFLVMAPARGPVAEVCAPAGGGWRTRAAANARLIAAAPELLALAESITQTLDDGHALAIAARDILSRVSP